MLAFSTAHRLPPTEVRRRALRCPWASTCSSTAHIDPLFYAAVEATEAAIVNALLAAETMTGRDGITAHALGAERLVEVLSKVRLEG